MKLSFIRKQIYYIEGNSANTRESIIRDVDHSIIDDHSSLLMPITRQIPKKMIISKDQIKLGHFLGQGMSTIVLCKFSEKKDVGMVKKSLETRFT